MRIEWDATVKGFGIRITSTGAVAYILNYRSQGYLRQVIIGRPGEMVLREERRQARVADGRMGARTVKGYELQARLSMLTENCSLRRPKIAHCGSVELWVSRPPQRPPRLRRRRTEP